jgi:hypothetical protein
MGSESKQPTGIGRDFLDWGPWIDTPPTLKHISDNLRAYLTLGAYLVLLHYLWNWGPDKIPGWVFQATAVIWGGWLLWFALLTVLQTWYLYVFTLAWLLLAFLKPYLIKRKSPELTSTEEAIAKILFIPIAGSGLVLTGGVFYLAGAMLRSAKLM